LEATVRRTIRRAYLIVAAFLAGGSVMIIELAGNRILAPWFGNSLYTWTGLIGVILVSISAGYYLGGYLADRRPDYVVLSHLLTAAAILTILVPTVATALEELLASMGVVWGPVLATALLFAVPGCLLAAVSPFAIRLISLLSEDKTVGVSAGTIGMVATLGSVVGTFGSGFVLIPHMGLRSLFITTGLILAVLSGAGYLLFSARLKRRKRIAAIPLLAAALSAAYGFLVDPRSKTTEILNLPAKVIFEQTTFYHRIQVAEMPVQDPETGQMIDTALFLKLDTTQEGSQFVRSPQDMVCPYQDYWQLVRLFSPELKRAVFLGGGAFTMPEAVVDAFPQATVDVVEIDPAVIEVGRKYFRVRQYERRGMTTRADDARRFLRSAAPGYDVIFGDAYSGVGCVPAHLVTREFFQLVESRLNDRGIYIMNLLSAVEGRDAALFRSVARTLSTVFDHQWAFATTPDQLDEIQNLFIVAASHDLEVDALRKNPGANRALVDDLFQGYLSPEQYDLTSGMIFTDDCNPVEYLVAKTLRSKRSDP
jgi:predicted membrane-bound spermidine synthase